MTTLVPVSSGRDALQDRVPVAVPELPVEVVHFTLVTPTLSVERPLSVIAGDVVDTMLNPGERICSVGAVVSPPAGGVTGGWTGGAGGWTGGVGGGVGVVGGGVVVDGAAAP